MLALDSTYFFGIASLALKEHLSSCCIAHPGQDMLFSPTHIGIESIPALSVVGNQNPTFHHSTHERTQQESRTKDLLILLILGKQGKQPPPYAPIQVLDLFPSLGKNLLTYLFP